MNEKKMKAHEKKQAKLLAGAVLASPPKALAGDKVSVHNYKSKGAIQKWENGTVNTTETSLRRHVDKDGTVTFVAKHSYRVILDRTSTGRNEGHALWLHVGDSGIRLIEPEISLAD